MTPFRAAALALSTPLLLQAQEAPRELRVRSGGPVLRAALEGSLGKAAEVVFAARRAYADSHWYANVGYYCGDSARKAYAGNGKPDTGLLLRADLRSGGVAVVFDAKGGSVRDPQVHYDGRRILFSLRRRDEDAYHLWEIAADGTGLRQITDGPYDDYEPTWLPDGDIAFVSTRCRRWVNCWTTQVGILYRCSAEGGNLRPISANTEHDNTPWVLPDGRLLYTRWEYVDRSQVDYHHLWTAFPDGTGHAVYYGNMRPGIVMIDAKPVPGSSRILANFSPGHGVTDHAGIATLVSPGSGPDDPGSARPLHQGRLVRDPWPLAEDLVLAAQDERLVLIDGAGRVETVLEFPGSGGLHEPRLLAPRPRETLLPSRARPGEKTGRFVLADVNEGRNLQGVAPGEVKKLLVLESLPKPVNFSGGPDVLTWLGTFTLERVLGTVPVEPDGSAYFEAPANRQLFFVSLDGEDRSVKRMQSFASVAPGETLGCVGCHESRTRTASARPSAGLDALRRPPSPIRAFEGQPDVIDMRRDVQPILDRHCVSCHGPARREGNVLLDGNMGPTWSHAYYALLASRQVADGRNGYGNQPLRSIGSSASPLLAKLAGGHHGAEATPEERLRAWLWVESGATFAGTYAALRNEAQQHASGLAVEGVFAGRKDVLERRCGSCHALGGSSRAEDRPLPYRRRFGTGATPGVRTAPYERIVQKDDPLLRYSENLLLDFSRPGASALLLAPLAKADGGWERCGAAPVFAGRDDPDLRSLLAAIESGRRLLIEAGNFGFAGFRSNPQYLREMRRYGALPERGDAADVFALDQRYWRLLQD